MRRFTTVVLLLSSLGIQVVFSEKQWFADPTPLQIAESVAGHSYVNKETFFKWEYGGAIIFDALYGCDEIFHMNYSMILGSYLDKWINDTDSYGYKVLHKITVPWGKAVGDTLSLFPINYLNRLITTPMPVKNFNFTAYREIAELVSYQYVYKWPHRLPDGTFSRHEGWEGQPDKDASFIWADDQFMGLTLSSRDAVFNADPMYAKLAANMTIQFAKYLKDAQDGLYYHGYNHATQEHSCCKWGRGNGWTMMAHIEVLNAVGAYPSITINTTAFKDILELFRDHAMAMIRYQSTDGRWHQVIDDKSTYLETSVTSMTLYSLIRGVLEGFLQHDEKVHGAIMKAWKGLTRAIKEDGTVDGICMGTGIMTTVAEYNARPTEYKLSSPGLGSVLYAANYMQLYMDHLNNKSK